MEWLTRSNALTRTAPKDKDKGELTVIHEHHVRYLPFDGKTSGGGLGGLLHMNDRNPRQNHVCVQAPMITQGVSG